MQSGIINCGGKLLFSTILYVLDVSDDASDVLCTCLFLVFLLVLHPEFLGVKWNSITYIWECKGTRLMVIAPV